MSRPVKQKYSEKISRLVGTIHLLFGGMLLMIYLSAVLFSTTLPLISLASVVIVLFLASAAFQRQWPPVTRNMVWAFAAADLLLFLLLIWSGTGLYGGMAAAALKSPSVVFLFALIALQAVRHSPALILFLGGVAAGGHLMMFMMAVNTNAELTSSYTWYQNSPSLMLAAEGELLIALVLFSLFLSFALRQPAAVRGRHASQPLTEAEAPRAGFSLQGVADPPVAASWNRPLKVLIAEDNQVNMLVLERMLSGARFDLVLTEDGQQALDAFEQMLEAAALPDVILLDIDMPLLTGHETAAAIRQREEALHLPAAAIIAVTAQDGEAAKAASLAAGMNDHLVKPVRQEELLTAISCALAATSDQQYSLPL